MVEEKTAADLNPRSAAVKQLEMVVLRALQFVEEFDKLEKGMDWRDVPATAYRKIYGNDHYQAQPRMEFEELWNRYKDGTLYAEIVSVYQNLPPSAQQRSEIKDGIARINEAADSGGKRKPPGANARRRQ